MNAADGCFWPSAAGRRSVTHDRRRSTQARRSIRDVTLVRFSRCNGPTVRKRSARQRLLTGGIGKPQDPTACNFFVYGRFTGYPSTLG